MIIMGTNLAILVLKFYLALKIEKIIGKFLPDIRFEFFEENNKLGILEHFVIFSSSFSDGILILSYFTGVICLQLLGNKDLFKNINNITVFFIFTLIVTVMVSTNNLLIMFICFELLFIPTIYFSYKLGYSKKNR
jgi:NADH:ubiquinone oxidoreductase subunit 2 (subunit N)